MNIKRAIGFSAILYVLLGVVYGLTFLLPFLDAGEFSTRNLVFFGIMLIPLVLIPTRWFFNTMSPTAKHGFHLGLIAMLFGFFADMLLLLVLGLFGVSIEFYTELYTSWRPYMIVFEVIALTSYAGWEFDGSVLLSSEIK